MPVLTLRYCQPRTFDTFRSRCPYDHALIVHVAKVHKHTNTSFIMQQNGRRCWNHSAADNIWYRVEHETCPRERVSPLVCVSLTIHDSRPIATIATTRAQTCVRLHSVRQHYFMFMLPISRIASVQAMLTAAASAIAMMMLCPMCTLTFCL